MTVATRLPAIESPCNKICAVDPHAGVCMGCGRNLAEITGWIGYSDSERARIMAELPARLESLQQARSNPAKPG